MTAKGAFRGDGVALNDGGEGGGSSKGEVGSQVGTGFGKRAGRWVDFDADEGELIMN